MERMRECPHCASDDLTVIQLGHDPIGGFARNTPPASRSRELLTQCLKQALALFDVRVLDHFVVAGGATRGSRSSS
jgi:hypothetical protein